MEGNFGGGGVWLFNQDASNGSVGWQQLTNAHAAEADLGGFATFQGTFNNGEYEWTYSGGWVQLTTADCTLIDAGD